MIINTQLNSSSVILVSGGGRGITAQCIVHLAHQYHCKFILLGRSPLLKQEQKWSASCIESKLKRRIMEHLVAQNEKPTPTKVEQIYRQICHSREINQTIADIEAGGGRAEYLDVDITKLSSLRSALSPIVQSFGRVTGIIHGAGTLADKQIENKKAEDFDRVYDVKIEGLENLLNCVDIPQLQFITLFSSFVSFYGNVGQSDYSLANEILNKYAYLLKQKYPDCHVVSVGWGPWDGGMVTPQLKELFEQQNIKVIPIEVGAEMLAEELAQIQPTASQILVMSQPISVSPTVISLEKNSYRIYRRLTLDSNPFVYDHVFGGNAVLPVVCVLGWMTNTCEQLYPGYRFDNCHDYKVLKGIVFDTNLAQLYCLDLTEIAKSQSTIELEALIWSETAKGIPLYHYRAVIQISREAREQPNIIELVPNLDGSFLDLAPYKEKILFHETRFRGIKKIKEITPQNLLALCSLPQISSEDQGQFLTQSYNPYTADLLFQCLLVWVRQNLDLGSLPLKFKQLKQFAKLPFDCNFLIKLSILEQSNTEVIADAIAYNLEGQVYLELAQMQVTPSKRLNSLFLDNTLFTDTTIIH